MNDFPAASDSDAELYVVGIGSSAGGLEAISSVLSTLAEGFPAPIIIAQHLSPRHRSLLAKLVQRATSLDVVEAEDGAELIAGRIYIIPENRDGVVEGRTLRLPRPRADRGPHPSVNLLFTSMAEEWGARSIGVVLSGTGSDGAAGAIRIDEAGGTVFVQDSDSAKYWSMPKAVIDAGVARAIQPPEALGRLLEAAVEGRALTPPIQQGENALELIDRLIEESLNFGLRSYKESTVRRRLAARMAAVRVDSIDAYIGVLRDDPEEMSHLVNALLIPVTTFFRDPESFDALRPHLKEKIQACAHDRRTFRAWVPGVCSGEEAFSIAILFEEICEELGVDVRAQIFATDLAEDVIVRSRRGLYPPERLADLPPEYLDRYFQPLGPHLRVSDRLRERVVFARHDLLRSPPFRHLDLVSCRNVLIYFTSDAQTVALGSIATALDTGGLLFLGSAETVGEWESTFTPIDGKHRIYRRSTKLPSRSVAPAFSTLPFAPRPESSGLLGRRRPPASESDQGRLEEWVLSQGPPHVLLGSDNEVLNVVGRTRELFEFPRGPFPSDVFALVPESIALDLRTTILSARRHGEERVSRLVRLPTAEGDRALRIRATPAVGADHDGEVLVAFETVHGTRDSVARDDEEALEDLAADAGILGQELMETRAQLGTVIEELEVANEELQAANEELMSSNEEFQATNEELETANEELQATNEELETVNDELGSKNREVTTLAVDLQHVLDSLDGPVFVLDARLQIRSMNPPAIELMRRHDIPLADAGLAELSNLFPSIDVRSIMPGTAVRTPSVSETIELEGATYSVAVSHVVGMAGEVSSTVIALHDVTEFLKTRSALEETSEALRQARRQQLELLDGMPANVALLDETGRVLVVNETWRDFARQNGFEGEALGVGDNYLELCRAASEDQDATAVARALERVLTGDLDRWSHEYPCHAPDEARWFQCLIQRVHHDGQPGAVLMHIEITERVEAEAKIRQTNRLEAVGQLTGGIAHDFNNLLAVIQGNLEYLRIEAENHGELVEPIDESIGAVARGAGLTTQMLSFARRKSQHLIDLDLNLEVTESVGLLRRTVEESYDLVVELPDVPLPVYADQAQLSSALMNLVLNARDAMPSGGTIRISVDEVDADSVVGGERLAPGRYGRIVVEDEGTGMDPSVLDKAFEPFFTTKEVNKGTGLGLSMVYGFAEQSGGQLRMESELGVGTRACIYLPLTERRRSRGQDSTAPHRTLLEGRRVLVVEDEDGVRAVARRALEMSGAEVLDVQDGGAAIELLRTSGHGVEAIVSDVTMPGGVSGLDLLRHVRTEHPGLGVILISGYPKAFGEDSQLPPEEVTLLAKPFRQRDLVEAVRGVLD